MTANAAPQCPAGIFSSTLTDINRPHNEQSQWTPYPIPPYILAISPQGLRGAVGGVLGLLQSKGSFLTTQLSKYGYPRW